MLLRINPDKINPDDIDKVVRCLKDGGIIIYPTDSVYALGCDMMHTKAVERICKLKNIRPEKSNFSFICSDLSHLSERSHDRFSSRFMLWIHTRNASYLRRHLALYFEP